MSTQANIQTVQNIYAAFGAGDLKGLFTHLAENVDWQTLGPSIIPQAGPHRGLKEVEKFFEKVGASYDIKKFDPREFIAQDDKVVVLGSHAGKAKPTGKSYEAEWAMVWTLSEGRVVKFREYLDATNLIPAFTR